MRGIKQYDGFEHFFFEPRKSRGLPHGIVIFFLALVRFSRPGKRLQSDALKIVPRLSPLGFRDGFVTSILEKKVFFSKPGKRLERAVCPEISRLSPLGFRDGFVASITPTSFEIWRS